MSVSCDFAEIAVITRGDKKLELPSQVAVRYCKYRSKQGWRVENRECLARRQIIQSLLERLRILDFRARYRQMRVDLAAVAPIFIRQIRQMVFPQLAVISQFEQRRHNGFTGGLCEFFRTKQHRRRSCLLRSAE